MKHIYLNLKRFDIPTELFGVNRLAPAEKWADVIVHATQEELNQYDSSQVEFVQYYPEAHLLNAVSARKGNLKIGCQSVYREDTSEKGNFGAFTSNRTGNAMKAIGVDSALIGHCEERNDKKGILNEAGVTDSAAVNRILNQEVLCAQKAGLSVLYCIGETAEEQPRWKEVLKEQLQVGLAGADLSKIVIGYEPVWSIGPGKIPADEDYITKVARFIKAEMKGIDVVYGGGLKHDNAEMLAGIPDIDGGLIALTRFSGEIGFYPKEYLDIIRIYLEKALKNG